MDGLVLYVNGKKVSVKNPDPETTLLQFLRNDLQLKGTKLGCGEGGCGACTVMVTRFDCSKGKYTHLSVNACLAPLCSVHGLAVTTVEGIGSVKNGLHPVQERLAKSHGTQCGFCTPGFVMSMYSLLCNEPQPSEAAVEEAFEGNLCRCTGYRPIVEGFKTFVKKSSCRGSKRCERDCQDCLKSKHSSEINESSVIDGICGPEKEKTSEILFNAKECFLSNGGNHIPHPYKELEETAATCEKQSLVFKSDRMTWYRPTSLDELITLKNKHPVSKIVIGNTEIGVEIKFKNMHYPVIIAATHVAELNAVQYLDSGIRVGASVTLATLEKVLKDTVNSMEESKTRFFAAIIEMLRWFAGPQIRNVAAIGGNIVTASPISDLNPLFLSAGCMLTLASISGGRRTVKMDDGFFTGYRKTIIKPDEILLCIELPFTKENEYFYGYKQSQRREDDIAIVNAGMRVLFEKDSIIIKDMALSYGGMAPFTVMATKTANELRGRKWDGELVTKANQLLAKELPLLPGTPGGMEAYRCSLTTSFFFKFYVSVRLLLEKKLSGLLENMLPNQFQSISRTYHREPSRGVQLFEDAPQGQIMVDAVGRPLPHVSALKQVTGEALFVDDMPVFRGEYYLSLVVSTKAHARIVKVDPSEALQMPGIVDYVSWKDIPGENKSGCIISDEKVFAVDMVTSQGMIIGAILADNQSHAQRAAKSVKVEYEELTPIITIEDAIAANSYLMQPKTIKSGDVAAALAKSDHVIEGELHIGGQEHFYLETQATLAVPKDGGDEMEVFCASQDTAYLQKSVADVLGVDRNKIMVRVKRLGGGFGGKQSRFVLLSLPVAVAAHKHNRPVRCMLDRDEDMIMTGTRHPYLAKYKVGFTKEGRIDAVEIDFYQNSGYSLDLSMNVMERSLVHVDNAYNIPNIRVTGHLCQTNTPSNTAFRGFGQPQATITIEHIMTDIIHTLKLSPLKVRELNMYKEGDKTYYNQSIENWSGQRCWDDVIKQSDYENRRLQVDEFNRNNRWLKRGISVIPVKYGVGFEVPELNQSSALAHIFLDGSVLIAFGGVEMGQGLNTKMIQVASRVLKIPTSKIYVSESNSSQSANAPPTAASVGSDLNGMAVMRACETLMNRLEPYIKSNPGGTWESWVNGAYMAMVSLSAIGFYHTPGLGYSWESNSGLLFAYFSTGVACSEVEIDCLTGDHTVLRTDIVMDVGKSLNPAIDIGQIEGAFLQGYGLFTLEDIKYSPSGYLYSRGPGVYKIPSIGNIPIEFNVTLLKEAPNPKAVYSSKAIGEPPLSLSASVFVAIKEAIGAARLEVGLEERFSLDSPATAERIRMACIDEFTKQHPEPNPGSFIPWSVKF